MGEARLRGCVVLTPVSSPTTQTQSVSLATVLSRREGEGKMCLQLGIQRLSFAFAVVKGLLIQTHWATAPGRRPCSLAVRYGEENMAEEEAAML